MKKWIKVLAVLAIIGIIAAVLVFKFVYNKPHPDFEKKKADYSLMAKELYESYKMDETAAADKFNGKVVEVSGTLSKVETSGELVIAVFEFEDGMFGPEGVRVTMLPNQNDALKAVDITGEIVLKGFCTGYNGVDVIIEKGSLVN